MTDTVSVKKLPMTAMTYPKNGTLVASSKAPRPRPVRVRRAGSLELLHAAAP